MPHVDYDGHEDEHQAGEGRNRLIIIGASGVLALIGFLSQQRVDPWVSLAFLLASMILAGYKTAWLGLRALSQGVVGINLLITIAAVGATAIQHLEEAASILFLFNLVEYLEEYASEKTKRCIETIVELRPDTAVIRKGDLEVRVPVEDVGVGDVLLIRPGEKIPNDSVIVKGTTTVDESAITGESLPLMKSEGDTVYAGTLNIEGYLEARAVKRVEESILSRICLLVAEAELRRSPTERFIDRFARYYTPIVVLAAVGMASVPPLVFGLPIGEWVYRSLVMLVLSCPCSLAISTPIAMVSAITSAASNGVLIKGGVHIEDVSRSQVFAFDKTVTLTEARLQVTRIVSTHLPESEVLRLAASIESRSEHPIGKAITKLAVLKGLDLLAVEDFRVHIGRGAEGTIGGSRYLIGNAPLLRELGVSVEDGVFKDIEDAGETVVLLSREREVVAVIAVSDRIRSDAIEALRALKKEGVKTIMLTGDNQVVAESVSRRLGIDEYSAGLLPRDKAVIVENLLRRYTGVVMIGDGVNDAPALARANVGVAMGTIGSDTALETADVALMRDDLKTLPYLLDLSRRTMRRVRENIVVSLGVKALCAVLVIPGIMTLWLAVIIGDLGLTLTVILNAMRLTHIRPMQVTA